MNLSGRGVQGALERAFEIKALGAGEVELPDVPLAKVAALARYGLSAKAPALRELSPRRRAATLLAMIRQLEIDAVDDALDLFDLLMATKPPRAERALPQRSITCIRCPETRNARWQGHFKTNRRRAYVNRKAAPGHSAQAQAELRAHRRLMLWHWASKR